MIHSGSGREEGRERDGRRIEKENKKTAGEGESFKREREIQEREIQERESFKREKLQGREKASRESV